MSREGDEDFITSELFGLWEGFGAAWVEQEKRIHWQIWSAHDDVEGPPPWSSLAAPLQEGAALGPNDVGRLLAKLRGEVYQQPPPR